MQFQIENIKVKQTLPAYNHSWIQRFFIWLLKLTVETKSYVYFDVTIYKEDYLIPGMTISLGNGLNFGYRVLSFNPNNRAAVTLTPMEPITATEAKCILMTRIGCAVYVPAHEGNFERKHYKTN